MKTCFNHVLVLLSLCEELDIMRTVLSTNNGLTRLSFHNLEVPVNIIPPNVNINSKDF